MNTYRVIGVMSGTSMDGVDLAYCELSPNDNGTWSYSIGASKTIPYSEVWRLRLSKLRNQNALVFYKTDRYYGQYIGQLIKDFLNENNLEADMVASHGHTVFHQPENNISVQVGSGHSEIRRIARHRLPLLQFAGVRSRGRRRSPLLPDARAPVTASLRPSAGCAGLS